MSDPSPPDNAGPQGLNPELRRGHDAGYNEDQQGGAPLDTISVATRRPDIWSVIWVVVTLVLVAITLFLVFA